MKLMKAASSSRRSSTIRADRTDQTEGDAVSRTGSSRFNEFASFVPSCISTWQNNSCQLHPAEQPTCRRGPLLQALQFVPCWLSSCEQTRSTVAEKNLPFILHKICTRSVLERSGRQKGGKDLRKQ